MPLLLRADRADAFKDAHLSAVIEVPSMHYSRASTSKFVICADDADAFCRMWFYSDLTYTGLNNHLVLRLHLRNPSPRAGSDADVGLPTSLQRHLLAPFAQIKNLHAAEIDGTVDASVKSDFARALAEPHDSPEACLTRCAALKGQGTAALQQRRYADALSLYERAFAAMHIVVAGRRRTVWADPFFEKTLEGGLFDAQPGGVVRMTLRIALVADVVLAHLRLGQPAEARFWGARSIDLMRQYLGDVADVPRPGFPGAAEWGEIYYRTGLACRAVGEEVEARELIRIAADWLPNDWDVQQEKDASVVGVA